MRRGNNEKFHGFAANLSDSVGTWTFVEVGAGFWAVATQITNNIIINDKDVQLLHGKGIKIHLFGTS